MNIYDANYWETLRKNQGTDPQRVSRSRFWEMLEVLPPENWRREQNFEHFMVCEAQTANLYTWLVRVGREEDAEYWEMIAPSDFRASELLARIETATRKEGETE
jgi:hypothetical protein